MKNIQDDAAETVSSTDWLSESGAPKPEAAKPLKHKIFCFNNGGSPGWFSAMAIADDGHCLAQHICSHEGFMAHDLGMTSDWKHENYNKHFGEGNWELEWVPNPRQGNHAGLDAAYALNQEMEATHTGAEAPAPDSDNVRLSDSRP